MEKSERGERCVPGISVESVQIEKKSLEAACRDVSLGYSLSEEKLAVVREAVHGEDAEIKKLACEIILKDYLYSQEEIRIRNEDEYTIYQAVQTGDDELINLSCAVIYKATYNHFIKYLVKYMEHQEDREDAVQQYLGIVLPRIIINYDPQKGSIMAFLDTYARSVFRDMQAKNKGAANKHITNKHNRITQIIAEIRQKTGNTNPTPAEIRDYDIQSGRADPLSVRTIQKVLSSKISEVSMDGLLTAGKELESSQDYDPFRRYAEKQDETKLNKALARIPESYRLVIQMALALDISSPHEENRQLTLFVKTVILKDSRATDDKARSYIETSFNEFMRAYSAVAARRQRRRDKRDPFFARGIAQAAYDRETLDIQEAFEEDPDGW